MAVVLVVVLDLVCEVWLVDLAKVREKLVEGVRERFNCATKLLREGVEAVVRGGLPVEVAHEVDTVVAAIPRNKDMNKSKNPNSLSWTMRGENVDVDDTEVAQLFMKKAKRDERDQVPEQRDDDNGKDPKVSCSR